MTATSLLTAVHAEHGHFLYESGHHGDLWLELDSLFVDAARMRIWANALAQACAPCQPKIVCGPLVGGAFLAQLMAAALEIGFVYSERFVESGRALYRLPEALRPVVAGQRVLVVDDAINAGSAVKGTLEALDAVGAIAVGIAALISLGGAAAEIASERNALFTSLASLERNMWLPNDCPLCATEVPLVSRAAGI